MNKLAKGFLLAFAALAIVALLLVLGMSLYVESEGVQTRLETALRRELKMPIKVTQIHFTPWGGLRVIGLAVPASTPSPGAPPPEDPGQEPAPKFLEAPEVTLRILWRPLLSRRLVVREMVISSPTIVWTQTSKGKWRLPKAELRPPDAAPPAGPATPEDGTASPKPRRPKAAKPPKGEGATAPSLAEEPPASRKLEFKIEATRIENATFRFLDKANRPIAVLEGVTVNCPSVGATGIEGSATIRKLTLHNTIVVESISTPFTYRDERLDLPQIDARLAGGSIHAAYVLRPMEENAPFTLDLAFDGVDLNRLIAEAGAGEAGTKAEGTLQGTLDLYGRSGQGKSLGGVGQVVLRGGRMEQYPLLQMIGQALQIDELTRLDLQQAQLDVRVGENRVYIDNLVLESANLNLSAQGESRLDGRLEMTAGLAINPKICQQLPRWIAANFKPVEGSDQRLIHFAVTGTLRHPETDLLGVLVGEKLEKQASDLFHAFRALTTGGGSKKKKKNSAGKKAGGATPAASRHPEAASAGPSPTAPPSLPAASSPEPSPLPPGSAAATPPQS